MGQTKGSDEKRSFAQLHRPFWTSGLGVTLIQSLGTEAFAVLMALADFMDKDGFFCWPSQKKLSEYTGYSEETVRKYTRRLEGFRFTDGRPLIRRIKLPNGHPGQSRIEYHLDPRCQVSHGPDPSPLDPALIPKLTPTKKQQANMRNGKALRAVQATAPDVQNVVHGSPTTVEVDTPTTVGASSQTTVRNNYTHTTTPNITTVESKTALPEAKHFPAGTYDSKSPADLLLGDGAADHVRGVSPVKDDARGSARDSAEDEARRTPPDMTAADLLAWYQQEYKQFHGREYEPGSNDLQLLQALLDAHHGKAPLKDLTGLMGLQHIWDVCKFLGVHSP